MVRIVESLVKGKLALSVTHRAAQRRSQRVRIERLSIRRRRTQFLKHHLNCLTVCHAWKEGALRDGLCTKEGLNDFERRRVARHGHSFARAASAARRERVTIHSLLD